MRDKRKKRMLHDLRYRPCRLSLQKERRLIRHAPARIACIVAYSPFTLKFSYLLYGIIVYIFNCHTMFIEVSL